MALFFRWVFVVASGIFVSYVGISVYGELRFVSLLNSPIQGGPVIWRGHSFANRTTMEVYRAEEDRNTYHPWTRPMEEWLAGLVLASCTGYLGGVVRFIIDSCDGRKKPKAIHCFMSLAIGICLMALASGSENVMLEGEHRFRYFVVAIVCFLAGIFVQNAWKYVTRKVQEFFPQ